MRRQPPNKGILLLLGVAALLGCKPQQPLYFHDKGDLSRYIGVATTIDYPDVSQQPLSEVEGTVAPFTLSNPEPKEIWELKLEDAVRYTLQNSKVMRSIGGQILGPPESLTRSPDAVPTIYDPAITETNARFGVDAALSLFDAQWTTDIFWERNTNLSNPPDLGTSPLQALFQRINIVEQSQFQTQLTKTNATGGTATLRHNVAYDAETTPRILASDWTSQFELEVRQPLLQGAGVEFNRIAGPGSIPGFNQGVMLARLNTDIALANFESGVRNLVSDVEVAYWELYFAYRNLDAAVAGRNSALQTWQKVHALFIAGAKGGEKATEAQAREQYFLFRSTVEQGLSALYSAESKLRYMMGLAATDGRLIRPADEPTIAKVAFDWTQTHSEALCRSVEIREAKWRVKEREMELIAAKNYLLPRLDAVGRYRWNGLGDDLIKENGSQFGGAYESLFGNNFQDWHLELQLQVPIGFRKQVSGVRNAQLSLARDRAKLQETELEVSHQLAYAIRDLDANLVLTGTNFNRRVAAERNVEAVSAAYDTGTVTIDVLLQAQRLLAQAESDYYRSLVNYNKSISQVHYRKGSLLEYNGVYLAEGPWPGKAYFDARRRARARDAARYLDYGFTLPKVVSRGSMEQHADSGAAAVGSVPTPAMRKSEPETMPELLPTPQPELAPDPPKVLKTPVAPKPQAEPQGSDSPSDGWKNSPSSAVNPKTSQLRTTQSRDLGLLDLGTLGGKATQDSSKDNTSQWTPARQTSFVESHETLTNPPSAETDRSASGWKGVQH